MVDSLVQVCVNKVMITILQGSVFTQTVLGWITDYPHFQISCNMCVPKIIAYERWLVVDIVSTTRYKLAFLAQPVHNCWFVG